MCVSSVALTGEYRNPPYAIRQNVQACCRYRIAEIYLCKLSKCNKILMWICRQWTTEPNNKMDKSLCVFNQICTIYNLCRINIQFISCRHLRAYRIDHNWVPKIGIANNKDINSNNSVSILGIRIVEKYFANEHVIQLSVYVTIIYFNVLNELNCMR